MNLVMLSAGEYSDYDCIALVDWKGDISPKEARKEFMKGKKRWGLADNFVAWVLDQGLATEVEYEELNFDYGD